MQELGYLGVCVRNMYQFGSMKYIDAYHAWVFSAVFWKKVAVIIDSFEIFIDK